MKLQDKETGEIWTLINRNEGTSAVLWVSNGSRTRRIESIEELTSRFEDYEEEPKEYWYIDTSMMEVTYNTLGAESDVEEFNKQIGNYFETEREAEEALEKLKAWKRLKDKGLRFEGFRFEGLTLSGWGCPCIEYKVDGGISDSSSDMQVREELDLLFGGKE